MSHSERSPLLGPPPGPRLTRVVQEVQTRRTRGGLLCLVLLGLGCSCLLAAVYISRRQFNREHPATTTQPPTDNSTQGQARLETAPLSLSLLSLMVWGSPGSFGTEDKARRIQAIGNLTRLPDWDLLLLSDLWMRPDHAAILAAIPEGHDMTSVGDLSLPSCDGIIAPEFCSGLAVISRHPIVEVDFTAFTNSGDLLWDYEYFLRRGVGRVRVEPRPGTSVDLFVTSLASMDYNYWYREHQVQQLLELVGKSTADYRVLAGDLNVDPRDGEDTYKALKGSGLKDSVEEFYKGDKSKYLDPSLSTLGNPANSYTSKGEHPVIYDYVWYQAGQGKAVTVEKYQVPHLTTGGEKDVSLSSHEAVAVQLALA